MIKHIVNWKLKESALGNNKEVNAKRIKNDLEGLIDKIDVIKMLEVGINVNENCGNYDLVLVSEFETMEALNEYATHPLHLEVVKFVKEVVEDRVAVDYEF